MDTETCAIRNLRPGELCDAREIYMYSFPPEERREWDEIVSMASMQDGNFTLTGIFIEGKLAGIGTRWDLGTFLYIEHLAIDSRLRSQGLGKTLLRALCNDSRNRGTILEVEPENADEPLTAKRIAFYNANGFRIAGRDYIQPPYAPGLPAVPLWLMACGDVPAPENIAEVLHTRVYKAKP